MKHLLYIADIYTTVRQHFNYLQKIWVLSAIILTQ